MIAAMRGGTKLAITFTGLLWYGDTDPLIFRSLEACQTYRKKHRVSRDDVDPWPTFR